MLNQDWLHGTPEGVPKRDFDFTHPVDDYLPMVRAVVTQPTAFFESLPRQGSYRGPLGFALIGAAISAILGGILAMTTGLSVSGFISAIIGSLIAEAIGLFVVAGIAQLLVSLIVGSTNSGYEASFRVVSYASVTSLVSWIPVIGPLLSLYGVYLAIVGIREMQQTTTNKAALVVLIPVVVLAILVFLGVLLGAVAALSLIR